MTLPSQQKAAREAYRQQVDQPVDFDFAFLDEIVAQAFHAGEEEERMDIAAMVASMKIELGPLPNSSDKSRQIGRRLKLKNNAVLTRVLEAITARGEKEELMDYERNYSHDHCWKQDGEPACGQPLEKHKQCCLCDTPHTTV